MNHLVTSKNDQGRELRSASSGVRKYHDETEGQMGRLEQTFELPESGRVARNATPSRASRRRERAHGRIRSSPPLDAGFLAAAQLSNTMKFRGMAAHDLGFQARLEGRGQTPRGTLAEKKTGKVNKAVRGCNDHGDWNECKFRHDRRSSVSRECRYGVCPPLTIRSTAFLRRQRWSCLKCSSIAHPPA